MQCSKHLPTTVDFGNNLVNYIEVSPDDLPKYVPVDDVGRGAPIKTPDDPINKKPEPTSDEKTEASKTPKAKPMLSSGRYSSKIPQYLLDLDREESSSEYQYAATAIEKLPTPPSLPGFLGNAILNTATPMKDDNSVLTMPNHTVLNHLATRSIKSNVLAVSTTTRYSVMEWESVI